MFRCTCRFRQQAAPSFDYCYVEIIVSMSRLTLAEYDHLCKADRSLDQEKRLRSPGPGPWRNVRVFAGYCLANRALPGMGSERTSVGL